MLKSIKPFLSISLLLRYCYYIYFVLLPATSILGLRYAFELRSNLLTLGIAQTSLALRSLTRNFVYDIPTTAERPRYDSSVLSSACSSSNDWISAAMVFCSSSLGMMSLSATKAKVLRSVAVFHHSPCSERRKTSCSTADVAIIPCRDTVLSNPRKAV